MEVFCHVSRGFSCNSYLCRCERTGESILVDPGISADEILARFGNERFSKIVLTHGHFDHVMCADELREKTGASIYAHRLEAELLSDPKKNASSLFRATPVSFAADVLLQEGDELSFGDSALTVLHTPGHSPGGISLFGGGVLFSGDALFSDGVGRTDLYGGDGRVLRESLARLCALPPETRVYPGHGEPFELFGRIAQNCDL